VGLRRSEISCIIEAADDRRLKAAPWKAEVRRMLSRLDPSPLASSSLASGARRSSAFEAYAVETLLPLLPESARLEIQRVFKSLHRQLRQRLSLVTRPCLELQTTAMRAASRALRLLEGTNSSVSTPDLLQLMRVFPVLARLTAEQIAYWRTNAIKLSKRLVADRPILEQALFGGRDLGRLVELSGDLSDRHDRGQAVAMLGFERGRVIYKPRGGEPEYHWFNLLQWINKQGLRPAFKTLRVLRRKGYCWVEYASPADCPTESGRIRFWRRLGALICVSHLLRAVDCHCENVIVAGEHPILVDPEAMLHPTNSNDRDAAVSIALLNCGWLPTGDRRGDSIRGIRCANNPPDGDQVREIRNGFVNCWRLLVGDSARRAKFVQRQRQMAKRRWRHIFRSTGWYERVSRASIQPHLMKSALQRRLFLLACCRSVSRNIARQELKALTRLDIPRFTRSRSEVSPSSSDSFSLDQTLAVLSGALSGLRFDWSHQG
jgi:lantibiotic modifying enzyme